MSMSIERARGQIRAKETQVSAYADASSQVALANSNKYTAEVASSIGDQMVKAQALQEQTEASNKATMAMNELKRQSSQDPDYKNSEKYLQQIDKIKTASAKGLTLKASRLAFDDDFFGMSESVKMDIKNNSHKKMVSKGIADLGMAIDNSYKQYLLEGDTIRQGQLVKRVDYLIDSHVDRGYLSPESGMAEKQKFKNMVGVAKFDTDLRAVTDPAGIDGLIEGLKKGDYEKNGVVIDGKTKETLIKDARSFKIKYGAEIKRQQRVQLDQNETVYGKKILTGELGIQDVYALEISKEISPGYADTLRDYLKSSKAVTAKNDPVEYAKILDEYGSITSADYQKVEEEDFGKIASVRLKIMQAAAKGVLTKATADKWMNAIQPNYKTGVDEVFLQSKAVKQTAFGWFRDWSRNNLLDKDQRDMAKMYLSESLMARIAAEEQQGPVTPTRANEIARETLDDYLRTTHKDLVGSEKITNSTATKKGGVRPITQDPTDAKASKTLTAKKPEYSDEDILFTANEMGMTVEEVKKKLGVGADAKESTS